MVFLSFKELPWFWLGFDRFWFAMLMVVLVPALLALVFGWLAFRSRVTGVYLSIMTQALTYALMLAFFRNDMGFGGNNGFTDFKDIAGFDLQRDATRIVLFVLSAAALAASYWLAARLPRPAPAVCFTPFGTPKAAPAFSATGWNRTSCGCLWCSAVIAGIAGALYVPQVGIINPGEFAPINSIEVVIWVAVGGRGTLYGAAAGAVMVNYAKTYFTAALPEVWLYALGALFVLSTLFLPRGLRGPAARPGGQSHDARQDALSRTAHGELRWIQGAQLVVAIRRSRRAALHHRPERRRQDDDDGRDHRQDAPRQRHRLVRTADRSAGASPSPRSFRPASDGNFRNPVSSST